MPSPDAIDRTQEPTFEMALRELRCILRWGLGHWGLAMVLAMVGGLALGWMAYQRPPVFTCKVIIDVRTPYDEEEPPPSGREVRSHLGSVVLSDSALAELAGSLGFAPRDVELFRDLTLSKIRDRIGLAIDHESPVRGGEVKTRLSLSFTGKSPELALQGARVLADYIVEFQNKQRAAGGLLEQEMGARSEDELRERLADAERRFAALQLSLDNAAPDEAFRLRLQLREAEVESEHLRRTLDRVSNRTRKIALRNDFERDMSGVGYVVVDWGQLPPPKRLGQTEKGVLTGVLGFLGLFLGLVLVLGGLSFRVYDADSLRRLGLHSIGRVEVPGLELDSWWARHRKGTR